LVTRVTILFALVVLLLFLVLLAPGQTIIIVFSWVRLRALLSRLETYG